MKKFLATLAAVTAAGLIYPQTIVVTDVDYSTDVVTIETATGFVYKFTGTEDYCENDLVSCIMFSNGTADITDDMILSVRYSGFYMD
jgi:hypothetical protein